MQPLANAMALIGNTPKVRVATLDTGPCEPYLKLESMNPTGSIKDRIGLSMIEAAETRKRLVIEAVEDLIADLDQALGGDGEGQVD
ncbi:hypothetical protein M8009_09695 [Halomonas sp. ATCH28]|uniref:cysteine synthase n=1 Tax=Halomonas gemina TaxID=2945105 RepID=A0ABT0T0Y4_9GAMM|nr:pyridoxal-phosphate dependent enzyme [Halomonas gemina]MCL7940570.1 hypothetical protein [Halomonas gemina]